MKLTLYVFLCSIFFVCSSLTAQPLSVVSTFKEYKKSIKKNEKNKMINLQNVIPNIILDLKYNTSKNFTKTQLYTSATTTYLRKDPAYSLRLVQDYLQFKKILKVFI